MNMPDFETNAFAGVAREFGTSEFASQGGYAAAQGGFAAAQGNYAVVPFEPSAVGPVCESIKAVAESGLPLIPGLVPPASTAKGAASLRPLHRIREVRREQGVSSKRAAQLMGKSVEAIRAEEAETTDLRLSQLYEWQRLLEVPIEDMLVEPHAPLSEPVLKRARMVRLMKTVQAIMERSGQPSVRRLAQTMVNQLIEIMPELEGVTPWNSLDRKKARNQNSRILESSYLNPAADEDPDE